MGDLRQRVRLVHELRKLRRAEELAHAGLSRLGVDQVMRHVGVDLNRAHALADRALHAQQADADLVFHQLAHRTDAAVAEVVDIVDFADTVLQAVQIFQYSQNIGLLQHAKLVVSLEIQTRIHLHAAHRRQVVALRVEEQRVEQAFGRFHRRRLAGAHDAVNVDQRFLAGVALVEQQRVADIRADIQVVNTQSLDLGYTHLFERRQILFRNLVTGFVLNLSSLRIENIGCEIFRNQLLVLNQNLFQPLFLKLLGLAGRNFCALLGCNLAGLGVYEVIGDLDAAQRVAVKGRTPALFVFCVNNRIVERAEDFLVAHALHHQRINILILFDAFGAVSGRFSAIQSAQQRRHRQLAAAVDANIHMVLGIEFEIEPRAAVRNNAGRKQVLARCVRLAAVVIEEHAGAAVHLGYDNALGAVDDERAVAGHQRHIDHVNVLLFNVANRAQTAILINIKNRQAQRDAQRSRKGHAALLALLNVVFRRFEFVFNEINLGAIGKILDREYGGIYFLKTLHLAVLGSDSLLKELFV